MEEIKVLILEDEASQADTLRDRIELRGLKVHSVSTIEEAKQELKGLRYLDLAVIDVNLKSPAVPGSAFCPFIRDRFKGDTCQIIYSGDISAEHILNAKKAGVSAYLRKGTHDGIFLAQVLSFAIQSAIRRVFNEYNKGVNDSQEYADLILKPVFDSIFPESNTIQNLSSGNVRSQKPYEGRILDDPLRRADGDSCDIPIGPNGEPILLLTLKKGPHPNNNLQMVAQSIEDIAGKLMAYQLGLIQGSKPVV